MDIFRVFIVQPIFNILLFLYNFIGDFGVAIIILTILIRFLLWPLVKKQLHQTKLMRSIQAELKKIKKKAGGNRMLESTMMMELYREKGIKPFSSILVLLIQLPIFIAVFQVVRLFSQHADEIGAYTYSFLKGLGRVSELIAHPADFQPHLLGLVDLTKHAFVDGAIYWPVMIMALLAALFQYVQSKQTLPQTDKKRRLRDIMREAANGKQADQTEMTTAMTGSMVKFFPIMTFFIAIYLPGAVVLYYATTSLVAVIQHKFVLGKDLGELEKIADSPGAAKARNAREAVVIRQPSVKKAKSQSVAAKSAPKSTTSGGPTVVRRIRAK
jgi:YidC/Oxa1 family membrane protein insertase